MRASMHAVMMGVGLAIVLAVALATTAPIALAGSSSPQLWPYTHDESIVLRNELRTKTPDVSRSSLYSHDESIVLRNELKRSRRSATATALPVDAGSLSRAVRSDGFSWGDFGIGAAAMLAFLGLVGAAGAGAVSLRHRTRRAAA